MVASLGGEVLLVSHKVARPKTGSYGLRGCSRTVLRHVRRLIAVHAQAVVSAPVVWLQPLEMIQAFFVFDKGHVEAHGRLGAHHSSNLEHLIFISDLNNVILG